MAHEDSISLLLLKSTMATDQNTKKSETLAR